MSVDTPSFLVDPPRHLFFTGKGGVGKTSPACASAVRLADAGAHVLLVSTDPASNIGQVFGQRMGDTITAVSSVPGLDAVEIDPQEAADGFRERIIGPVRGLLPQAEIDAMTEQLSGSCTTEVASFNEFTSLLADDDVTGPYDHVLFDTAPTGHTLRLLQLPGEWTSYLDVGKGDTSCLGPMAGLDKARATYARAMRRLADPTTTRLVLVARPSASALTEAARTSEELALLGITEQHLAVNAVLPASQGEADPPARAIVAREQAALREMPQVLRRLPVTVIDLKTATLVGVAAVRGLLSGQVPADGGAPQPAQPQQGDVDLPGLDSLLDELAASEHGLVLCMGKGGVGKTTIAAAVALALADRGKDVHLSTTDPAANLDHVLGRAGDAGLEVSRIDPHTATQRYRARVLAGRGAGLDEAGRALLAEDLRSPCTEEVAVFGEFSHLVGQARRRFVVIDTAPTGHTLLLMDATGSYHREMMRNLGAGGRHVTPLMRLQDPELTKVVIVTLPDTTPVLEAAELQEDLQRAGITPWAWVVNQSLMAAHPSSPLLRARAAAEEPHMQQVAALTDRIAVVPMLAEEPTGHTGLRHVMPSVHERSAV